VSGETKDTGFKSLLNLVQDFQKQEVQACSKLYCLDAERKE
jgi:hypothetical protein